MTKFLEILDIIKNMFYNRYLSESRKYLTSSMQSTKCQVRDFLVSSGDFKFHLTHHKEIIRLRVSNMA